MKIPLLVVVAVATSLSSASAQDGEPTSIVGTTNSMEVLDDNRLLSIGDLLSYRVVEDRSRKISRLLVTDSGGVEVPLVGRVPAEGKTCKSLAYGIKKLLEEQYYNKATVIISLDFSGRSGAQSAAASRGMVRISGSIARPGKIPLPPTETPYTLSDAILDSGGFTRFAKSSKVLVVRTNKDGTRKNYYINMDDVMKEGDLDKDLVLQPNDFIIVKDKLINF